MKFTDSHEWIFVDGEIGTVGISDFAQKELGEVVYIELPKIGHQARAGEEIAVLESTKAAADIYSPVSGEVIDVNKQVKESPQLINSAPQSAGWLYKIRLDKPSEMNQLLDPVQYHALVK